MIPRLLMITLIAALCLSGIAKDKPLDDKTRIQGNWEWDPAAKQSDAEPVVLVERIVIKGDVLTFHYSFDGKPFTTPTTFTLNPKATPGEIDFTPTDKDNANKGKVYLGRYEFKDGKLRICYRGPGSTRPKNFDDKKAGSDATTFITVKTTPGV